MESPLDQTTQEEIIERVVLSAAQMICAAQDQPGGLNMARAWIYQRPEQVRDMGESAAPWYVGWIDPDGKQRSRSCGKGLVGRRLAGKLKRQTEAQLLTGTYNQKVNGTWEEFRAEYQEKIVTSLAPRSRGEIKTSLDHFQRLIKPKKVNGIRTTVIDDYKAARLLERGQQPGTTVSHATVNKELRHLKAALKKAKRWGYLGELPEVDFLRELRKLPDYTDPDCFAKIYTAVKAARLPIVQGIEAADWWRAILLFAYMTGWRIGQLLAFRREDIDLETGEILTRAAENKGKRDQKIILPALALEHLKKLAGFGPTWFEWPHRRATLWVELHRLQDLAGVEWFGFHDLRRAFATLNADRLTPDALQALMQHRDYQTTQRYIALARQMKPAAANVFVPTLPKAE